MRYWVGVTDKQWFDYLSGQRPDEVNFWQPSPRRLADFLEPGIPFLFKLHAPNNFIVGGGFFVRFSALPARLAWEAFQQKNGVQSYEELRRRVERYRGPIKGDPDIGCNVLNSPFFFPREQWIELPNSWAPNIVRGKTFDTENADGLAVWRAIEERLVVSSAISPAMKEPPRYGAAYLTQARLGQGAFRVLVTDAYNRRCAVTGEKTLPVLEAAHIQPYSKNGPHAISNGILLRSDLHILFDDGYITLDEDLRLQVSSKIRERFENGREYYQYRGKPLGVVPANPSDYPSAEFIRWHNESVYVG